VTAQTIALRTPGTSDGTREASLPQRRSRHISQHLLHGSSIRTRPSAGMGSGIGTVSELDAAARSREPILQTRPGSTRTAQQHTSMSTAPRAPTAHRPKASAGTLTTGRAQKSNSQHQALQPGAAPVVHTVGNRRRSTGVLNRRYAMSASPRAGTTSGGANTKSGRALRAPVGGFAPATSSSGCQSPRAGGRFAPGTVQAPARLKHR